MKIQFYNSPHSDIITSSFGWLVPSTQGRFSILWTTKRDSWSKTLPNTTCLLFKWGVGTHVMKNYVIVRKYH